MAEELPPGTPEVNDPLLVADMIRLLSIKGAIGRLALADIVIPVISLGDVVTPSIEVLTAEFGSTDVFSNGELVGAAAGALFADTGPLAAGTFDVKVTWTGRDGTNATNWNLQHRDAADAASLMETVLVAATGSFYFQGELTFGYTVAENERLRIINIPVMSAGSRAAATIFARLRT